LNDFLFFLINTDLLLSFLLEQLLLVRVGPLRFLGRRGPVLLGSRHRLSVDALQLFLFGYRGARRFVLLELLVDV
jgi:hypothetical protein